MKRKYLFLPVLAGIFISSTIQIANAQVAPPANLDAGAIDQYSKNEFIKAENKGKTQDIKIDNKEIETPAVLKSVTFNANEIVIKGNTIFKTSELEKYTSELIGKKITLEDVVNSAKQITKHYRDRGYLTSKAYIPAQKIKDGVINITILEGKVGEIKINETKWVKTSYLKNNLLKSNKFEENKVFNVNDLKGSISEINSQEYLKGKVILEKGKKVETTDIVLEVEDKCPLDLDIGWDNTGRNLIGVQRSTIGLSNDNLTGYGDKLYANTSLARRTVGVDSGYIVPLGDKGTKLKLGYSYSDVELGGMYKTYNIDGKSHDFNIGLQRPLYKGETLKITSDLTWDMRHSETTIGDTTTLNKYDVRALRTGVNLFKDDFQGRWASRFEVSTGIPIMGGTDYVSSSVGSSRFVKLKSSLNRYQILPANMLGIFRSSVQYSPTTLLTAEQMQLGGMYTVRGFDEGVLLGDAGYNISLEVQKIVPYLPEVMHVPYWKDKTVKIPLKNNIKVAAFYDQGWAKNVKQGKVAHHTNFLQSIGVGLRCRLTKTLSANFDLGIPLGRKRYAGQNDVRFHFSISSDMI